MKEQANAFFRKLNSNLIYNIMVYIVIYETAVHSPGLKKRLRQIFIFKSLKKSAKKSKKKDKIKIEINVFLR